MRKDKSTELALDYITSLSRKILEDSRSSNIGAILSLDISGAYDRVLPKRLLFSLKRKGILEFLISFISSFLTNRTTTLLVDKEESSSIFINIGVL